MIKRFLGEFAGALSAVMLFGLVLLAVSAVFLRYIVNSPLVWAEEVEVLALMWIIMIGSIYAMQKNSLLRMDIVYNVLSPGVRRILDIVQYLIQIVVLSAMVWYGWELSLQMQTRTLSMLGLPYFWVYLSMPVGAAGMLIVTIMQLVDRLRGQEN